MFLTGPLMRHNTHGQLPTRNGFEPREQTRTSASLTAEQLLPVEVLNSPRTVSHLLYSLYHKDVVQK